MGSEHICEPNTRYRIVEESLMLGVLICDDDLLFLERIQKASESYFQSNNIKVRIYAYSDAKSISPQIFKNIDIALLDIDFENCSYNGINVARNLRSFRKDSIIIFITNFIEYAPEGYEVQAFRYLLKKQVHIDLAHCLDLAVSQLNCVREMIKFQINGEPFNVPLGEILYFSVYQHSVTIHLAKPQNAYTTQTFSFYSTLNDLEDQLSNRGFLRIHKSYLVNIQHIAKFKCREATLDSGEVLRVSEKNYAENKNKYLLWKGWYE